MRIRVELVDGSKVVVKHYKNALNFEIHSCFFLIYLKSGRTVLFPSDRVWRIEVENSEGG